MIHFLNMSENSEILQMQLEALKKRLAAKQKQLLKWEKVHSRKEKLNGKKSSSDVTAATFKVNNARCEIETHKSLPSIQDIPPTNKQNPVCLSSPERKEDSNESDGKIRTCPKQDDQIASETETENPKPIITKTGNCMVNGNDSPKPMSVSATRSENPMVENVCSSSSNQKETQSASSNGEFSHRRSRRLTSKKQRVESKRTEKENEKLALSRALIANMFDTLIRDTKKLSVTEFVLPESEYTTMKDASSPIPKRSRKDPMDILLDSGDQEMAELAAMNWGEDGDHKNQTQHQDEECLPQTDNEERDVDVADANSIQQLSQGLKFSGDKVTEELDLDHILDVTSLQPLSQEIKLSGDKIQEEVLDNTFRTAITSSPISEAIAEEQELNFHFVTCIKSRTKEPVEKIDVVEDGQKIVAYQKSGIIVWSATGIKSWQKTKEHHLSKNETLLASCTLQRCAVLLVRNEDHRFIRFPFDDNLQDQVLSLPNSKCTDEVLLCAVGENLFACCTSIREVDATLRIYSEGGETHVDMEITHRHIASICGVKNQDGALLGYGDGIIFLWNCWTGKLLRKISVEETDPETCLMAVAEEGLLFCLLTSRKNETCHLVALNTLQQTLLRTYRFSDSCTDLLTVPSRILPMANGLHFARTNDRGLQIWDILCGKIVATLGSSEVSSVQVMGEDLLLVGYRKGCVHVFSNS